MKTFEFAVDLTKLKLTEADRELFQKDNQRTVFENVLNQALQMKSPNGLPTKEGRILSRICDKLDRAEEGKLELEEAEFDLIEDAFFNDKAQFQPAQYRLISQYQLAIEKAKGK